MNPPNRLARTAGFEEIGPQPGPQTQFLSTPADIAVYGGAAGGGKTFGMLLESTRNLNNPRFGSVFFRRTRPEFLQKGGAWDASTQLFPRLGGIPNYGERKWYFRSGATFAFQSLQHEKSVDTLGDAQIPLILIDEATTFSERMFWALFSRNRSDVGVVPYMRLGTNPDPDSWLLDFIGWWINPETGYPIAQRSGAIRWFCRPEHTLYWGDSPEQLRAEHGPDVECVSVTFIPAKLTDNQKLLAKDPKYLTKLLAMPYHEKARLLGGNWLIKLGSGMFQAEWFKGRVVPMEPPVCARVRYWDTAGTGADEPGSETSAWTVGVLMAKDEPGRFYVVDVDRFKLAGRARRERMRQTADMDKLRYGDSSAVVQWQEHSGAGTGKEDAADFVRNMAGHECRVEHVTGDKVTRAGPYAAQVEHGNVYLVSGPWIPAYLRELEAFPKSKIKDQVDASSGAFNKVVEMAVHASGTGIIMPPADRSGALPGLLGGISPDAFR